MKEGLRISPEKKKATRQGFGDALVHAGEQNPEVVALCADLSGSLRMDGFRAAFPDRFFQVGVAEANMMGLAAGLSIGGKIPFTGTFANFSTGRVYDQIRQSIAYSRKNVKICASHAGLTLGEDGATHQILEDIGMMKMLPDMVVINPCDYAQTYQATLAIATHEGPAYLRFGRPSVPCFTEGLPFRWGEALRLTEGHEVSLFATGHLVYEALQAQKLLAAAGLSAEVINIHTIKPLDEAAILASAKKTGAVVTAEEHMMAGGLGDSIAQLLVKKCPLPQAYVAVQDTFGESGKPDELMQKYQLTAPFIAQKAREVVERKKASS